MANRVLHISEEEPARNFAEVLAQVRAGAEVVIDGHGDFARDLEGIINSHREPLNPPAWD